MSDRSSLLPEPRARQLLAAASKIQFRLGLTDYLGHTSMRLPEPDRYLIKPKHSPSIKGMDTLGPQDFIVVDGEGLGPEGTRPPAEVFIHTEIFRQRRDVNVVVHTHQPKSTLMGVLGAPILPLLHIHAPLVERPIPTWPCSLLVTDRELGNSLARALGDGSLAHLQGHGIVSVGSTIQEASVNAIHLEQIAAANLDALQSGSKPRVIPADQIVGLRDHLAPVEGRWAYYASITGVTEELLD